MSLLPSWYLQEIAFLHEGDWNVLFTEHCSMGVSGLQSGGGGRKPQQSRYGLRTVGLGMT